jgi:hypothetical protein
MVWISALIDLWADFGHARRCGHTDARSVVRRPQIVTTISEMSVL